MLVFGITIVSCGNANEELPDLTGYISINMEVITPKVGGTLTVHTNNLEGTGTIYFRWLRGNDPISGATNSSYILVAADEGHFIRCEVSRAGYTGTRTIGTAITVLPANAPSLTGTISLIGTPTVGQTLTADTSNLSGSGTIIYVWFRESGTNSYSTIFGETSDSYTLTTNDVGRKIYLRVTREGHYGYLTTDDVGPVTQ